MWIRLKYRRCSLLFSHTQFNVLSIDIKLILWYIVFINLRYNRALFLIFKIRWKWNSCIRKHYFLFQKSWQMLITHSCENIIMLGKIELLRIEYLSLLSLVNWYLFSYLDIIWLLSDVLLIFWLHAMHRIEFRDILWPLDSIAVLKAFSKVNMSFRES